MKTTPMVIGTAFLAGAGLAWLVTLVIPSEPPVGPVAEPARLEGGLPREAAAPAKFVGITREGKQLTVDLTRLDEREYQNDPAIQYLAGQIGIPAACVLENFKLGFGMLDARSAYCEANDPAAVPDIPGYVIQNPEYEKYSVEQLEQLAPYELDAAMLLARKHAEAGDAGEAQKYYEEAMRLLIEQGADPALVRNEMKGRLP